jgi:hypothetical protein
MRTLLVKLQFKLASWLYNKGIIAPQLLEHKKIRIMNDEDMEMEKIVNCYEQAYRDGYIDNGKSGEVYYNETYGNNK